MRLTRIAPLAVLVASFLLLPVSAQQQYGRYEWAMGLHEEFGFDDMAETILKDMASGTSTERLKGQLGLARLKAAQGRRASALPQKLSLLGEAADLMDGAIKDWPDKDSRAYFDAIFQLVTVLESRGELAYEAIKKKTIAEAEVASYKKTASDAFTKARFLLEKNIRGRFEDADYDSDREKWRLKNRAWYTVCSLMYNEALTVEGNARYYKLQEAGEMLEDFILENDSDIAEAWVGSLYGSILKGRVLAAKNDPDEAVAYISAVLDQVNGILGFDKPLENFFRGPVEQAYFRLFEILNENGRYGQTIEFGKQMRERYARAQMRYGTYGQAAKVELARAYFQIGDRNQALGLAAEVVDSGTGGAAAVLANRVIAEVIAATPDKSQFSPAIIGSAADGAWSRGREGWDEAARYYRILLQVVDQEVDEATRKELVANAWFRIGYVAYDKERWLEAAMSFEKGAKLARDVEKDDLGRKLVQYWGQAIRKAEQTSPSEEIARLQRECRQWQIDNPAADVPKGDLLYAQAEDIETEAKAAERSDDADEAIAAYRRAAQKYEEAAEAGGRKKERAMVKTPRSFLKAAKIHIEQKQTGDALSLLTKAKEGFKAYLEYASNPQNVLTDPQYIAAREAAQAEARYSIADANEILAANASDEARKKELLRELVDALDGFENEFSSQGSLVIFALYSRLDAQIALDDDEAARRTYEAMKVVDADHRLTARGGALIAKTMRTKASEAWDKIVGKKFDPSNSEEWSEASEKAGFETARRNLLESARMYRDWLTTARSAQSNFGNWTAIGYYFWEVGAWEEAVQVYRKALKDFEGRAPADDYGRMQYRHLIALHQLARSAQEAGRDEEARRYWNECGDLVDDLLTKKMPLRVREIAAEVYGGYVYKTSGGFYKHVTALEQYDKANDIWRDLYNRRIPRNAGDDAAWEARFYLYFTLMQARKAEGKTYDDVTAALEKLERVMPEMGGEKWKPLFEWMKRTR